MYRGYVSGKTEFISDYKLNEILPQNHDIFFKRNFMMFSVSTILNSVEIYTIKKCNNMNFYLRKFVSTNRGF